MTIRRTVITFERARETAEVEANFLEYLKRSYNVEPLQFLHAVEKEFKKEQDVNTKVTTAKNIIDTYVRDGCQLEINIDGFTKKRLMDWYDSPQPDKLENLFEESFKLVTSELKSDSYTRYLDSEMFKEFVKKKGEKYISTLREESEKKQIQFSPFNVNGCIKDQDIVSLLRLVYNVEDWIPLQITKKHEREKMYYSYLSALKYPLDGVCPEQMAAKFVGVLPVSAEDAMYALLDREYRSRWEPFTKLQVDLPPHTEGDYQVAVSYAELKFMPIMSSRYCIGQCLVVYDTERRAYLIFSKTSTGVQIDPKIRNKPNSVPLVVASIHAIYKISDDKCRYVTLSLVHLNTKDMANNFAVRTMFKKRGKTMFNNWVKLSKERIEKYGHQRPKYNPDLDTLDEFNKRYLSEEGASKTWDI